MKECDRCGVPTELPAQAAAYSEGLCDGEITLCIECTKQSREMSLRKFFGGEWHKNKKKPEGN